MEVLARYCSIPGYSKLCCDSCSKRSSLLLPEAAETEEEVRFGSASQLLETLSASINGTLKLPPHSPGPVGRNTKQTSTAAPHRTNGENKNPKRSTQSTKPSARNLPAMAAHGQSTNATSRQPDSSRDSRWPKAVSEVKR